MNLKKLDILKTNRTVQLILLGVVLLSAILLYGYCSASPTTNVPKGERYEANSNIAQQKSVVAETEANNIANQRLEAHKETVEVKGRLKQRTTNYDSVRQTNNSNGVNGANLDTREHQLRSDLERLYPGNR